MQLPQRASLGKMAKQEQQWSCFQQASCFRKTLGDCESTHRRRIPTQRRRSKICAQWKEYSNFKNWIEKTWLPKYKVLYIQKIYRK